LNNSQPRFIIILSVVMLAQFRWWYGVREFSRLKLVGVAVDKLLAVIEEERFDVDVAVVSRALIDNRCHLVQAL